MSRYTEKREHGSEKGYKQHLRHGEIPCGGCYSGHSAHETNRRRKGRCARGLGWPLLPAAGQGRRS